MLEVCLFPRNYWKLAIIFLNFFQISESSHIYIYKKKIEFDFRQWGNNIKSRVHTYSSHVIASSSMSLQFFWFSLFFFLKIQSLSRVFLRNPEIWSCCGVHRFRTRWSFGADGSQISWTEGQGMNNGEGLSLGSHSWLRATLHCFVRKLILDLCMSKYFSHFDL